MKEPTYEPKGLRFYDARSGRDMLLIDDGERYAGWLCYRHPDGQWVTLRQATDGDRATLAAAREVAAPKAPAPEPLDPAQKEGFAAIRANMRRRTRSADAPAPDAVTEEDVRRAGCAYDASYCARHEMPSSPTEWHREAMRAVIEADRAAHRLTAERERDAAREDAARLRAELEVTRLALANAVTPPHVVLSASATGATPDDALLPARPATEVPNDASP